MKKADWTLIIIAAASDASLSPIQLQKALFLISKTIPPTHLPDFYLFKAYNYGPFSQEIYLDAERLAAEGYVEIFTEAIQTWSSYRVTSTGKTRADLLRQSIDTEIGIYIDSLVTWIRSLSFEQLLGFIYTNYKEFSTNSIFRLKR